MKRVIHSFILLVLIVSGASSASFIIDGPANVRQDGKVVMVLDDGMEVGTEGPVFERQWLRVFLTIKATPEQIKNKKVSAGDILVDEKGNRLPVKVVGDTKIRPHEDGTTRAYVIGATHIKNKKIPPAVPLLFDYSDCKDLFEFEGWKEAGDVYFYGKCVEAKQDIELFYRVDPITRKNQSGKTELINNPTTRLERKLVKGQKTILLFSELYADDSIQTNALYFRVLYQFDEKGRKVDAYAFCCDMDDLGYDNWLEHSFSIFFKPYRKEQ